MFPTMFQVLYNAQSAELKKVQTDLRAEEDACREMENMVSQLESQLKDETAKANRYQKLSEKYQKESLKLAKDVVSVSDARDYAESLCDIHEKSLSETYDEIKNLAKLLMDEQEAREKVEEELKRYKTFWFCIRR